MQTADPAADLTNLEVSLAVHKPLADVWSALMTPPGNEALLGTGGRLGSKGDDWRATDGSYGVTRSFHPMEQIRFSWHADGDAPRTVVDLRLSDQDGHTRLDLAQDRLPADADLAALSSHWEDALTRLADLA